MVGMVPQAIQIPTIMPTNIRMTMGTVMDLKFSFICSSISAHLMPQIMDSAATSAASMMRTMVMLPPRITFPTTMPRIDTSSRITACQVLTVFSGVAAGFSFI